MPPPSSLKIKTSSVARLIKEEQSYHKELVLQKASLRRMEDRQADEYEIKQQKQVITETEKMIPEMREKLMRAAEELEMQLELVDEETDEKKDALLAMEEAKKIYEGDPSLAGSSLFTDVS